MSNIETAELTELPVLSVFDERVCSLGEGPLWHPIREELFWVDIPTKTILGACKDRTISFECNEIPSALGWIDERYLVLATETGLHSFCVNSGAKERFCEIEFENTNNRSNDGRTDPWGGFWISTMGKNAEPDAGSLYRWYQGTLRKAALGLTIPNGTCFDRIRQRAYFVDSAKKIMYSVPLDVEGWAVAPPSVFMDFSCQSWTIDGAITDIDGNIWCALWDGSALAKYSPQAQLLAMIPVGTSRPTCPAFGGPEAKDMYVTTASIGLDPKSNPEESKCGQTLVMRNLVVGAFETKLII